MYYYVYILQSISNPERYYIGCTRDLKERIKKHNEGGSPHTSKYIPWKMTTAISFSEKHKAFAFEPKKFIRNEFFAEGRYVPLCWTIGVNPDKPYTILVILILRSIGY